MIREIEQARQFGKCHAAPGTRRHIDTLFNEVAETWLLLGQCLGHLSKLEDNQAVRLTAKVRAFLDDRKDNPAPRGKSKASHCGACECELGIPGGYGGSGLCGPCATGESSTLEEKYDTW